MPENVALTVKYLVVHIFFNISLEGFLSGFPSAMLHLIVFVFM